MLRLSIKPEILNMIRDDLASGHGMDAEDGHEKSLIMQKLIKARDEALFSVDELES